MNPVSREFHQRVYSWDSANNAVPCVTHLMGIPAVKNGGLIEDVQHRNRRTDWSWENDVPG